MGDSLTAGYQSSTYEGWAEPTPYTTFLEERLLTVYKGRQKGLNFQIHNKGVSGELTGEMLVRFNTGVLSLKPNFVIILGGTNDIGWGLSPNEVFNNLTQMYEAASKSEIETIACSVPSILGYDSLIPPRLTLNEMIRSYCIQNEMAFADIFRATADPKTNRLLDEYSNDGLHLNTYGYQKMADTIFEEALERLLVKYLSKRK